MAVAGSDAQLVRRAWKGDQAAFGELVDRYRGAVYGLARRLAGDPEQAQDLAQEAFLRAYVRLGELHDPERFGGWIMAIAHSVCMNWVSQQAVRRALETGAPLVLQPAPPTPAEELHLRETAREVRELVHGLPEPYRSTAQRYYLDDQPQAEIARDLGVAVGTVKARLHHARRKLQVSKVTKDWYGELEMPTEKPASMTPEELARGTLEHYDLGSFEALGSVYAPSSSIAIGVQTSRGRYRMWRYGGHMTPELVELQHEMLRHLAAKGVAVKRLVPARDGTTWQQVDGQLVAIFEWFSGETPDLRDRRDLTALAELHAKWTLAMEDFDPPMEGWRKLAATWRPRKLWAWSLPMEELPLVPQRMGFFSAVREVSDAPAHHQRMIAQVQDIEQRLGRFDQTVKECRLAELPRSMNHGVFLFGLTDWELMVTDGDDFVYEARVADLGRLLYAIHDRRMPEYEVRDRGLLAVDTYREHVELSEEEARALPLLAWGMVLYYDVFNILLYLMELDGPDRGEYLVAKRTSEWIGERDRLEASFEGLADLLVRR